MTRQTALKGQHLSLLEFSIAQGLPDPDPFLTFNSVTWPNPNDAAIVFLSYSVE